MKIGLLCVAAVAIICVALQLGLFSKAVACIVQHYFVLPPLRAPAEFTVRSFSIGPTIRTGWRALDEQNTINGWVLTRLPPAGSCSSVAVLVHGWAQDRRDLEHAVPAYIRKGFCVVSYDARWRGGLSWGSTEAADAAEVIRWVQSGETCRSSTPPSFLLVHGMSQGSVAAALAVGVHGAQPDALILESPYASPSAMLDHLSTSSSIHVLPIPDIFKQLLAGTSGLLRAVARLTRIPTALEAIQTISTPTLLIAARSDPLVPVSQTLRLAEAGAAAEFGRIDVDHNGKLSISELRATHAADFSHEGVDSDHDGEIDIKEFQHMATIRLSVCDHCNEHATTALVDRSRWEKMLEDFLSQQPTWNSVIGVH